MRDILKLMLVCCDGWEKETEMKEGRTEDRREEYQGNWCDTRSHRTKETVKEGRTKEKVKEAGVGHTNTWKHQRCQNHLSL